VSPSTLRTLQVTVVVAVLAAVGAALLVPMWLSMLRLHDREDSEIAATDYDDSAKSPLRCEPHSRPGPAGNSPDEETPKHVRYSVKTPANYDSTRAHPLIVVYAPHGVDRFLSELFVGLTRAATRAGFVIAYADSRPLDLETIDDLGVIPDRVAARWCIDERRIHLTGHSDGGTVATAIVLRANGRLAPAAIAPSAAGFRRDDLAAFACPAPVAVLVLHNRDDGHFPGYGEEAVEWWAACNACGSAPEGRADGCLAYPDCRPGGATLYCEGEGGHVAWPNRNQAILEFFRSASRSTGSTGSTESRR
jgi:polyhydroxybutyrate depolymerase